MGNGHGTQGERGYGREKKFRHCVSHLIHGESPDKENNFGSGHVGSNALRCEPLRSYAAGRSARIFILSGLIMPFCAVAHMGVYAF
jgi:hypothetical protein